MDYDVRDGHVHQLVADGVPLVVELVGDEQLVVLVDVAAREP